MSQRYESTDGFTVGQLRHLLEPHREKLQIYLAIRPEPDLSEIKRLAKLAVVNEFLGYIENLTPNEHTAVQSWDLMERMRDELNDEGDRPMRGDDPDYLELRAIKVDADPRVVTYSDQVILEP